MEYTIHTTRKKISFSTDTELVAGVYKSENGRCYFEVYRASDEGDSITLCKHWFESEWLHIMLFGRQKLYIHIGNDDALDEIRKKLTDIGIEVS